jgi:hypothetical protein
MRQIDTGSTLYKIPLSEERILVQQFVCDDPLCGGELFQLVEREHRGRYTYVTRYPMGEETELQAHSEKLTDDQVFKLLDLTNWLDADISLESADISGVEDVPSLLGGNYPLFTISGSILGAELKFREWVVRWIKKNRHSLE